MNENEKPNGSFEPKPAKAPNNKKALIIIVAVALVAIIAIIGAAIASKSSKKAEETTAAEADSAEGVSISVDEMNGAKISNVTKRGNQINGTVEYNGTERGFDLEFYSDTHSSTHQNVEVYIKDIVDYDKSVDVEVEAYCEDCYNAGEDDPYATDYINFSKDEPTADSTTEKAATKETTTKETTTKETTTEATTTKATTTKETTTKSSVDIRKIADDFDEWVDSYVAFMKKVEEDDNYMLSHYSEYMQFMTDYTEWLDDMASYDEDDYSASDWAYFWAKYTEALAKIEKM